MTHSPDQDLRLADLSTFLGIVRAGSVSGAARALEVTPSQASKALARLERQLGVRLLLRGARGIALTETGKRLVPDFERILQSLQRLRAGEETSPELTVVSSAYLSALFVPHIAVAIPEMRIRSLELPPGVASAHASGHSFDIALTTSEERWPDSWVRTPLGALRKALFAPPSVARRLGRPPVAVAQLAELRFITPIYGQQGQLYTGDDGCPLQFGARRVGNQTQSLAVALETAALTEHVVFAPVVAVRAFVAANSLVEVPVRGWSVSDTLYLVCDGDRVRAPLQKRILAALAAQLPS